jgi:hypothetical protein
MTLLAASPLARPRLRSVLPDSRTAPPQRLGATRLSVTGIQVDRSAGKHSWKLLTRSTARPRSARSVARTQPAEEPLDAWRSSSTAGDRLVHEVHGCGLPLPVDAGSDGLVGDGPRAAGHGPLEALPSRLDVVRLAAVDGRERVLADPQGVGRRQVVGDGPSASCLVAQPPAGRERRRIRPPEGR